MNGSNNFSKAKSEPLHFNDASRKETKENQTDNNEVRGFFHKRKTKINKIIISKKKSKEN